jgi:exonuclease III
MSFLERNWAYGFRRKIRVDFDELSVMSLYLPSGTNSERLDHKFMFMDDFQNYITDLKKEIPNLRFAVIITYVTKP